MLTLRFTGRGAPAAQRGRRAHQRVRVRGSFGSPILIAPIAYIQARFCAKTPHWGCCVQSRWPIPLPVPLFVESPMDQPFEDALGTISAELGGLRRAELISRRAAAVGFDWHHASDALEKVREEVEELQELLDAGGSTGRLADELGDILFAVANVARKLEIDPEEAIESTNQKFIERFHYVQRQLDAHGSTPRSASLQEMERLWQQAKCQSAEPQP